MAIHCAAAVHSGLIKNKEKKESSWVKLKAFPTNVGRPNKERIFRNNSHLPEKFRRWHAVDRPSF